MFFRRLNYAAVTLTLCFFAGSSMLAQAAEPLAARVPIAATGAVVRYQLPVAGPLPKTYRVTLAIVDPKNPQWIVSQFAAGVARTVTAENKGQFFENWNGLDDNFMPVPPGTYGVKGIFMDAHQWQVDNEWHSVTPQFVTGASAWLPGPQDYQKAEPFGGDPVGSPLEDVAVGANGVAVFYYRYLENGTNNPLIDLKKPAGLGQFVRAFGSGGAAGGTSAATDGETVWAFSADGGPKYVYRADGKSFGRSDGANRANSYLPSGWVTAMAAWHNAAGKPLVYIAQRGKIVKANGDYAESSTEFVDQITVHDGESGAVLGKLALPRPQALTIYQNRLYALSHDGASFVVKSVLLGEAVPGVGVPGVGVPVENWRQEFVLPDAIKPFDLEADSHGRFYVSDSVANKVYQLDGAGKVLVTMGRLAVQKTGGYDPESFMAPEKLATWRTPDGEDRLLVVEKAGPNRVSEWSPEGKRLRDFLSLQTKANDGYAVDPENPGDVYVPGQAGWLTRFKVDYGAGTWTVNAVWPNVGTDPLCPDILKPIFFRTQGHRYLACARSYNVYRLDASGWKLSAGLLRKANVPGAAWDTAFWNDSNGNGRVDDSEIRPAVTPPGIFGYHGQNWTEGLRLLAVVNGGQDVQQLWPDSFDGFGNPVFTSWRKLLTDPIFVAKSKGKADAVHGGNEIATNYSSDWSQADGSSGEDIYVQARGGPNFDANFGSQYKISRYQRVASGEYQLLWRTGRAAMHGVADPGEIYGAMRIARPINGLLTVVDQSRCGLVLYNQDGLYVDTLFPDQRRAWPNPLGVYAMPGEFFCGSVFPNREDGKVYFALGKFTPMIFAADGWSTTVNPVHVLTAVQPQVTISAGQIAAPPELALSVRGGAGQAKVARFSPALGGAVLDGSLRGWTATEPITFQSDADQSVEVRTLYDPENLYFRWHARFAAKFKATPLPGPERLFTHEQQASTLSFYVQGNKDEKPGGSPAGRPGDARFVFGIFDDGGKIRPVVAGYYPIWTAAGAHPQNYRTPTGQTSFAHVGFVPGARLNAVLDEDGNGFVLTAALPRSALPAVTQPFGSDFRTLVNFEATFLGHNKFWWANSDGSASMATYDEPSEARLYPGSWSPAQFVGLDQGVVVRDWQLLGPFGGPGAEKFVWDPNGLIPGTNTNMKDAVIAFCNAAVYPPDTGKVDLNDKFSGPLIQGYWPHLDAIGWRPATVAPLDTRAIAGGGAQVYYGATWIQVPKDTELEFQFQSHPQTVLRWTLNGAPLQPGPEASIGDILRVSKRTVTLRAGWNEVKYRGYCYGYSPFRGGLVLAGSPEKLWGLSFGTAPP